MVASSEISPDPEAALAALGLALPEREAAELRAAATRIASRIYRDQVRVVGFVPVGDEVAVPALIVHLGLALAELTGATIAVVDANVRYPGLAALAPVAEPASERGGSVFATRWLRGSLALLTPPRSELAGEVVPQLARALLAGEQLFAHVLVDLTGFDLLGEHATAAACMDAVAIVARAHTSRERALIALAELMPRDRLLGVLLVG